jgi:hypothetical protein
MAALLVILSHMLCASTSGVTAVNVSYWVKSGHRERGQRASARKARNEKPLPRAHAFLARGRLRRFKVSNFAQTLLRAGSTVRCRVAIRKHD